VPEIKRQICGKDPLLHSIVFPQPMTRMLAGGGSWNTLNARFYHQDHKGNLHYFFGASFEQSDYTNYGTADSWLNILQDPAYKKTKLYGKATYFLGREGHKISFFAQHTIQDGFAGRTNRDFNHGYDTINAVYSNEVNDRLTVQVKTGLRNYDRRWSIRSFRTRFVTPARGACTPAKSMLR
jgi:iron complex outermembrane recepter protein